MLLKTGVRHYDERQLPLQQLERTVGVEYRLQYRFFQRYLDGENTVVVDEGMDRIWGKAFCCPR